MDQNASNSYDLSPESDIALTTSRPSRKIFVLCLAVVCLFVFIIESRKKTIPSQTTSKLTQISPTVAVNYPTPSLNWKVYEGKYFSIDYRDDWINGPPIRDDDIPSPRPSETVFLSHILENKWFEIRDNQDKNKFTIQIEYAKRSYQPELYDGVRFPDLVIGGRKAAKFEHDDTTRTGGEGGGLPAGWFSILYLIEGPNDTTYTIVFDGDKRERDDEMMNRILSSFKPKVANNTLIDIHKDISYNSTTAWTDEKIFDADGDPMIKISNPLNSEINIGVSSPYSTSGTLCANQTCTKIDTLDINMSGIEYKADLIEGSYVTNGIKTVSFYRFQLTLDKHPQRVLLKGYSNPQKLVISSSFADKGSLSGIISMIERIGFK